MHRRPARRRLSFSFSGFDRLPVVRHSLTVVAISKSEASGGKAERVPDRLDPEGANTLVARHVFEGSTAPPSVAGRWNLELVHWPRLGI
jgi:hypothetical protein